MLQMRNHNQAVILKNQESEFLLGEMLALVRRQGKDSYENYYCSIKYSFCNKRANF